MSKKSVKQAVKAVKKPSQKPMRKPSKSTKAVKTAKSATAKKPAPKSPAKPKFTSSVPRLPNNPYKQGSSYGLCLDLIASRPEWNRQDLIAELSRQTGKPVKNCSFDTAVVVSRTEGKANPHSSSRGNYLIAKINDNIVLKTAPKPAE